MRVTAAPKALACPSCGEAGRGAFEERGHEAAAGDLILRCTTCLAGMTVAARRGLAPRRARLIDPDTWSRMELALDRESPRQASTAPDPIEDPAELVLALRERGIGGDTLMHLVAETLSLEPPQAGELIARVTAAA